MKRNTRTRLIAMILTLVMVLLTGCGTSGQEETKGQSQTKATETAKPKETEKATEAPTEEDSNFNKDGLPIVDETVTFTIVVPQLAKSLVAAAEKKCVIDAENATNVHIEWIEIPSSGWEEKINLMFNTGELPDAIIGNVSVVKYYEQLTALNGLLEEYAPNVTAYFETTDDYPGCITSADGNIYGLPRGDENVSNKIDSQLWINKKWLEELKLEVPTTVEQFKNVLIAFRDRDPNGNGKADEVPFIFEAAWGWGSAIENLFGAFGVLENDNHVYTKDNKVTFSAEEKGYYNALLYLNGLKNEGLLDKDIFTLSSEQFVAKGASGGDVDVLGAFCCYSPENMGVLNPMDYTIVPMLTDGESKTLVLSNNLGGTGFYITTECETPEILVRWYDYINSDLEITMQWSRGEKGVLWDLVEVDGKTRIKIMTPGADVLSPLGFASVAECRQTTAFAGQSIGWYRMGYDLISLPVAGSLGEIRLNAIAEQLEYGVVALPSGTASVENAERRSILITDIDNYLEKFIANSVINGIDEAKWAEHLQALKDLKVDEYKKLCQEYVDSTIK